MEPRLLTRRLFKTKRAQSFNINRAVGERAVKGRPLPGEGWGQREFGIRACGWCLDDGIHDFKQRRAGFQTARRPADESPSVN